MSENHLTANDIEQYVENAVDARAEIEQHLATCAQCRRRVARERRVDAALQTMPRAETPRELAVRISAAVELRVAQEQARRTRVPFIAVAMSFSLLLVLWFGMDAVLAFQESSALDFFTLFTDRPDLLSTYSFDAVLALIEALPISEILLTLFALVTAIVLTQQLVDTLRPRAMQFK
jgi:predicted anti-sigma-YlaC factor YlaD